MKSIHPAKHTFPLLMALIYLLICRLFAMYFIPLNDSTEARYTEMARKMLETGNWITPLHDYGVPFWGKPPLSTWLSAFSMKLFGISEFASRLPSLLLSLGVLWLLFDLVKKRGDSTLALTTVVVLASTLAFLLDAGAVMTDPALLFSIVLAQIAFWNALREPIWGYVFFVGLGLGLLAKGPIAVLLTLMPVLLWTLLKREWKLVRQQLPWWRGFLLMLLISLPWYLMAEMRTPGFLNYFIMGEHVGRFLIKGWQGDKYGFAHSAPYGMILVYALCAIFPWTLDVLYWFVRYWKKLPAFCKDQDGWTIYWLLCAIVPLVFFTFAKNIIWPYVLPSLPAFALLFVELMGKTNTVTRDSKKFGLAAFLSGFLLLLATTLYIYIPQYVAKSQKPIVRAWQHQHPSSSSQLIYWSHTNAPFSAQFYAQGNVRATLKAAELEQIIRAHSENYVVIDGSSFSLFPKEWLKHMTKIQTFSILKKTYTLYCIRPVA